MSTAGAGLAKARRKLGTVSRSLRLTRKGTLASSTGLKEAVGEVRGATSKMRNLSVPLRTGALDIDKHIRDNFNFERNPDGTPWKEVEQATIDAKVRGVLFGRQRNRPGGKKRTPDKRTRAKAEKARAKNKILVDSGDLAGSWFAEVASKTSIRFGTKKYYGDFHQRGAGVPVRMQGPVEYVNGQWKLINRGPAKLVFDRIGKAIMDYVAPEVD